MPLLCLSDLFTIMSKLESNEIRKILVLPIHFLNLKNIIPSYTLIKNFLVCLFRGLDSWPGKFQAVRLIGMLDMS